MRPITLTMPRRRPQPPYAHELVARLYDRSTWPRWFGTSADGRAVCVFIAAGGPAAWAWARKVIASRLVLVAPVDRDPATFDWAPVAPHAPVVVAPFGCGQDFTERLSIAVLRDGASSVVVASGQDVVRYMRSVV